jgi:hypothetical protein
MYTRVTHDHLVELNAEDLVRELGGPAPDVERHYARESIVPHRLSINYHSANDLPFKAAQAVVWGFRRLANGGLGREERMERFTTVRDDWPDWVKKLTEQLHPTR